MKLLNLFTVAGVALMLLIAGCAEPGTNGDEENGMNDESTQMQDTTENVTTAMAVINPTQGNDARGTVTFTKGMDGVQVEAEFSGLPEGPHAFHVHLYGDCSADDGTSAGTHFNFIGSSTNPPADIDRITGNLGDAVAGADGNATADTTISNIKMSGPKSIIGRSVIIHASANDPSQPPIGAAGSRLGCGVIGIAETGNGQNMNNGNM